MEPALPQKLYLMTDANVLGKLKSPVGRLEKLLKSGRSDEQILEELFLATLTRYPAEADRRQFADYRKTVTERRAAFTDTLWALMNTREFILKPPITLICAACGLARFAEPQAATPETSARSLP